MAAVTICSDFGAQKNILNYTHSVQFSSVAQLCPTLYDPMDYTWVQSLRWEDSPGEGNGNPLKYSCLENSMDRLWCHKELDMTEQLN